MVAGVSARPVWMALKPWACCRNTDMTKNEPCMVSHWTVWVPRPRFAVRFANIRRDSSGSLPRRSVARMCRKNQIRNTTPMATNSHTGEIPPLGMSTVLPIEKSSREVSHP